MPKDEQRTKEMRKLAQKLYLIYSTAKADPAPWQQIGKEQKKLWMHMARIGARGLKHDRV